ncbi:35443_t:CDS:1 [Gigaspora margarita]|uniref:35443_t:CDS:1 n=1 Tax=Gigaspora margarita TaxID=4874 RepID=A0ABN7W387_GIGMA|nr:35443_t:CDS:1 [Gigaspora margarita]
MSLVLDTWNEISEDIIIWAFMKCGISNCLSRSKDHFIYITDENESDEGEIKDFDDEKESGEDNEYKEFDEVDEVEESNKNKEFDKDNKSDSDESDYRVSKWPECFVLIEKRKN